MAIDMGPGVHWLIQDVKVIWGAEVWFYPLRKAWRSDISATIHNVSIIDTQVCPV